MQVPITNLPAWVNSKWFNSVLFIMLIAQAVLLVVEQPWAPAWVRILTAVLTICGMAVKPGAAAKVK